MQPNDMTERLQAAVRDIRDGRQVKLDELLVAAAVGVKQAREAINPEVVEKQLRVAVLALGGAGMLSVMREALNGLDDNTSGTSSKSDPVDDLLGDVLDEDGAEGSAGTNASDGDTKVGGSTAGPKPGPRTRNR